MKSPAIPADGSDPKAARANGVGALFPAIWLWGLAAAYLGVGGGLAVVLLDIGGEAAAWAWLAAAGPGLLLALTLVAVRRMVRVQQAAQQSNEILADAFSSLLQPALVVDSEGRAMAVNAAFEDMFECAGADPMAALEARLGAGEAATQELRRISASAAAGRFARAEIVVPVMGGEAEWFAVAAAPIAARPGHVLWRAEDITARRQLEQVIRDEHDTLFDFLENAPVGFYSADEGGRILFVNNTLAGWLGCTAEEILGGGMRIQDFVAGPAGKGRGGGVPGPELGLEGGDVILRGRQGQILHAFISQTIVEGKGGAGLRTRSVVRDLTREREWEEALIKSEHRFERFFEDAPVGIALVDPEGRITECNRALRQMAAPDGHDVVGLPVVEIIADEDRAETEHRLSTVAGGGAEGAPLQVTLNGDPERAASLFVSRVGDVTDGLAGLILHFLDTTERRKLELRFAQSQKMEAVGQLAGGIAHDFNNLLTAMIGFCDLLLLRHRPGEQSFADIMQIKQNANRAANLVRQLLAFSRQQPVKPKVLGVTDVLAELSNLLRRLIGERIELKMIHGRDLGLVKMDQGQLEQVIVNLAVNARDAMADGGTLTIRTSNVANPAPIRRGVEEMPAGEYTLIEVGDSGTGIAKDQVDRIFDPFFSTKEVGAGTGLGLSTVHGIVKQAEGYIFVDTVLGQGTKFSIFLPRYRVTATAGAGAATVASGVAAASGVAVAGDGAETALVSDLTGAGTILLVEDEDAVRLFSARALRNKGYKVLEARGGTAAMELMKSTDEPIDLLITDVVMPDMDGPALVEWVRERQPDMRVICISGYAEETLRKRLDSAINVHFLAKPFSLEQLAGTVKEVVRRPLA